MHVIGYFGNDSSTQGEFGFSGTTTFESQAHTMCS